MTISQAQQTTNWIKQNILTGATLIVIIGFTANQSARLERIENKLLEFEQHQMNTEMHIPVRESMHLFVPRTEIDARLRNIEKSLESIDKKV